MESGEGNKGTKRKSEENAEESANKRLRPDAPLTSLGTEQDKQGQEDTNWMKHVKIEYEEAPECASCDNKKHSCNFYIDIEPLKKHLVIEHKKEERNLLKDVTNWIFYYFHMVKHKNYLKCREEGCNFSIEVLFRGPLKDYIKKVHGERAKQDGESSQGGHTGESSQGDHKDVETAAKLIRYLFQNFLTETNEDNLKKCQKITKLHTWWRGHCDTKNYQKGKIKCKLCKRDESFTVSIHLDSCKMHMTTQHKDKKVKEAKDTKWFAEHFQFASNAMWCIICRKPLTLHLYDETFENHLENKHNVISTTDLKLIPDSTDINRFLFRYMNDLIDDIKVYDKKGNKP